MSIPCRDSNPRSPSRSLVTILTVNSGSLNGLKCYDFVLHSIEETCIQTSSLLHLKPHHNFLPFLFPRIPFTDKVFSRNARNAKFPKYLFLNCNTKRKPSDTYNSSFVDSSWHAWYDGPISAVQKGLNARYIVVNLYPHVFYITLMNTFIKCLTHTCNCK